MPPVASVENLFPLRTLNCAIKSGRTMLGGVSFSFNFSGPMSDTWFDTEEEEDSLEHSEEKDADHESFDPES